MAAAAAPPGHAPATSSSSLDQIYDTIELAEMEFVEDDDMYYYECPCGDLFEISPAQLAAGEDIARCPSCSLKIRVLVPKDEG